MEALQKKERYTYADYEQWGDDYPRCELIDGVVYMMASPSRVHQQISGRLLFQLQLFLHGKTCEVYHAPFDVRLNYAAADDTVVQPDLLVVCDMSKLENGKHCLGAPDLVIEILSPSNTDRDMMTKFKKYLKAKVREYWVVDTDDKTVVAYRLLDTQYIATVYEANDEIPVVVLEGCAIRLSEVFAE